MSEVGPEARSFLRIELTDLERLLKIAKQDRQDFFKKYPGWAKLYQNRVLGIALCQGSAQHSIDGKTGINDFDVWTFYKTNPQKPWCYRRLVYYDYGDAKFGQSSNKPNFIGRRVDCLGRDISVGKSDDVASAIQTYLRQGKTASARLLAQKAVVLLEPNIGKIIWQAES